MSKLSNELLMLQYLNTGKKYSLKELSNLLEVSERMIRIYKEDMEKSGIFVDTIKGPYGGYVLKRPCSMPTQMFSERDYALLKQFHNEEIDELIVKMKCISFEEDSPVSIEHTMYNVFSRAIKEKRKMEILYFTEGKGKRRRVIHPFHILVYGDTLAVAAFCEYKQDFRNFAFPRILEYSLLAETF